jgi:hypothetical protein
VQPAASWTPATNGIAVWFTLYAPQAITRTPVAFQGQTAAARRATMRTLPTTTQAQTASFVWGWFRKLTVAATQATSAALSSGRAFLKAVTATQATTATIRRALGRTLAAVQGSAATRGLGRVLAAVQRLVASLTNIQDTAAFHSVVGITIDGVDVKGRVRMRTLTIHDALNDAPNTCALAIEAPQPKVGQRLRVTINAAHPQLLFDGPIDSVMTSYEGLPAQVIYNCTAGDDLVLLNRKRPFGAWTNVSATTVAQNLITQFGPGFTSTNVAPGLPVVSVVFDGTATFGACLQQLAKLIGGYFYVEDLDLHLFLAEPGTAPDPIDATHKFLDSPPITASIDTSQVRTRLYGKGHSEQVPCDVLANDTILPIADAVMFSQSPGGLAIVATTPDGAQHQRINYTDRRIGGASSFVGPGAAPSVAPTATGAFGSSALAVGATYQYAYTWVTAAGESRPSPTVPVTPGTLGSAGPANGPSPTQVTNFFNSDLVYGQQYNYACAWNYATGLSNGTLSALGPARSIVCDHWWNNSPPDGAPRYYTNGFQLYPPSGAVDARAKQLWIFRQVGGSWYYVGGWTVSNGTVGNQSAYDSASDAWCVGYNPPHGNPAQGTQPVNQFTVGGVAVGPSGTTIRRIYRTGANAAQLKLLATLSDNSTTAMAAPDNVADASLGVNAPTADTSGLVTQSGGQVLAGSTTIPTASAGPFPLAGWAFVGANWIRYTGISGNALTGVPASGPGSLVNTINYGEHIVVADVLLGVSQLNLPVLAGSSCAIWVQVDDVAAQANMQTLDGGDGIYEDTVVDERRAAISLGQLCQANLALYNNPIITITYATRDPKTKSGKRVVVTLDAPLAINQTLVIHTVDITEIDIAYATMPRFTVTASTVRYSLEDLLRQLATANNATTS